MVRPGWRFPQRQLHVVERYTPPDPYHIKYEATIEDPNVFTRPWKISMPLYRTVEKNAQLLEFKCVSSRKSCYTERSGSRPLPRSEGEPTQCDGRWFLIAHVCSRSATNFGQARHPAKNGPCPRRRGAIPTCKECGPATWACPCSGPRISGPRTYSRDRSAEFAQDKPMNKPKRKRRGRSRVHRDSANTWDRSRADWKSDGGPPHLADRGSAEWKNARAGGGVAETSRAARGGKRFARRMALAAGMPDLIADLSHPLPMHHPRRDSRSYLPSGL